MGRLVHLVPCLFMGRGCFLFRTDNAERIGGDEHRILEVLSDVLTSAVAVERQLWLQAPSARINQTPTCPS